MQIQIKKQLKIELDQADIVEAVGDFLLKHNQKVSAAELEAINFVKSPKDGLRATLNITEESGTDTDEAVEPAEKKPIVEQPSVATTEPETETVAPDTAPVVEEETHDEEPGTVEPSTVEDVMPSVDEVAAMVEPVAVVEEEEAPVATAPVSRSALFANQ